MSKGQRFRSYCFSCHGMSDFEEIDRFTPAKVRGPGRPVIGRCQLCRSKKRVVRAQSSPGPILSDLPLQVDEDTRHPRLTQPYSAEVRQIYREALAYQESRAQ